MEVLTASIHSLTEEKGKLIQENKQLSESLSVETKSRSVYSVLLVRHVVSRRQQRNNLLGRTKSAETPDQPFISNDTSPYHHKDTTITLSNNNVILTIIIIIIIAIYFVISLYHLTMKLHRI